MTRHIALAHSARPGPAGARWHWPDSTGRKWGSTSQMGLACVPISPYPPISSSPPTHPNYLLPISPSWLKIAWGGARWREKGRSSGGRLRFVCLCGWTLWTRSHASVLLHPRKHRLIPHSPRFGANQNKPTGRQTASLEVTSGIGRLVFLQLKTSPVANSCNELSYENCRSVQRSRSERKDESGSASSSAKRCFLDGTWWKMETMATGRCTRVS